MQIVYLLIMWMSIRFVFDFKNNFCYFVEMPCQLQK